MTLSISDFSHIKWSLLTFLLVLGVGSIIIMGSENFVDRSQRDQRDAKRQLSEARSRLATAGEDHENMQTYTLEYNALLKRNVIGSDQRLDWIEGLEKIRKQNRVPGFKYAIAPQKPYTPAPPLDSGNFDLNLSDMTLQFELLHEEQLTAFFDAMRTDINGWFLIDHCSLERTATTAEADGFSAGHQLKAECAGGWLTLKNRNAR
ncbi:MAG: hypothetical protein KGL01_09345 [Betaproteobacteria bacterium]|nr:hypothetical protein [Betaproteobacteria bacterium]